MDYKLLLEKYIQYVSDVEGTDFIYSEPSMITDVVFSEEEWSELKILSKTP